jgi:hypothetical protein
MNRKQVQWVLGFPDGYFAVYPSSLGYRAGRPLCPLTKPYRRSLLMRSSTEPLVMRAQRSPGEVAAPQSSAGCLETPGSADVSESGLRILIQKSAFSFVIRNEVGNMWAEQWYSSLHRSCRFRAARGRRCCGRDGIQIYQLFAAEQGCELVRDSVTPVETGVARWPWDRADGLPVRPPSCVPGVYAANLVPRDLESPRRPAGIFPRCRWCQAITGRSVCVAVWPMLHRQGCGATVASGRSLLNGVLRGSVR